MRLKSTENIRRRKVLIFVGYYVPGYKAGGPIRSVAGIAEHLGTEMDFWIVTRNRDLGETAPYSDIRPDSWLDVGTSKVWYCAGRGPRVREILRIIRDSNPDSVYINSVFDFRFSLIPILCLKILHNFKGVIVLAPRGEFSKGALSLKKVKKALYLLFLKYSGLLKGKCVFQASSEMERNDILRGWDGDTEIRIAGNLSKIDLEAGFIDRSDDRRESDGLRIVFLSRISPMKNLLFALNTISKLNIRYSMDIYGPIGDVVYWQRCQDFLKETDAACKVAYKGEVAHEKVTDVLKKYDILFLPSLGENFGQVILESLVAGTPVLLSDRTPWASTEDGACTAIPLARMELFVEALNNFASLGKEEQMKCRLAASAYGRRICNDEMRLDQNRRLFDPV